LCPENNATPIALGMKAKICEPVALFLSLRTLRSIFSANFAVKNTPCNILKKVSKGIKRYQMLKSDSPVQMLRNVVPQ
jgi:hypothetical protein